MKKTANRIIDLLMVILLPLLMAYSLIGESFHEVIGTAMLILFISHHFLHRSWWKAIPKGRYSLYRVFITVLNVILSMLMILQPISGIAVSRHLYTFLPLTGTAGMARAVHLVLAYWCYVLMCFHLGLHVDAMVRSVSRKKQLNPAVRWTIITLITAISAYGIYAFIHRGFPGYMFLKTSFAFFDYGEPRILFFADYLAIMILFTTCGYAVGKF